MSLSRKQLEEIDFLEKNFSAGQTSLEQKNEYINWSVRGKRIGEVGGNSGNTNPLAEAKRRLDINIKMWREDLQNGLFSVDEFTDPKQGGFDHPFALKLFKGILKGIDFSKANPLKGSAQIIFHNAIRKKEYE